MNIKNMSTQILFVLLCAILAWMLYRRYQKTPHTPLATSTSQEIAQPESISPKEQESGLITAIKTFNEFEQNIQKITTPLIIKCFGSWCPPCKAMRPIYEQLAHELQGKVSFFEIDVDNFDNKQKLTIRGIPAFLLYKNGKEVKRIVGARTYNEMLKEVLQAFEIAST